MGKELGTYYTDSKDLIKKDVERTIGQATGFNNLTHNFLSTINFLSKAKILVPAIGAGPELPILAAHGVDCTITGLDLEPMKLEAARKVAKESQLEGSTSFKEGSMESLPFEDNSFDISYIRLGLQHTTLDQRQNALSELKRVVKPNGLIMAEDLTIPLWQMWPPSETFEKLKAAFITSYKFRGTESEMGIKLPDLWSDIGLTEIRTMEQRLPVRGNDPFAKFHIQILKIAEKGVRMAGAKMFENFDFDKEIDKFEIELNNSNVVIDIPLWTSVAGVNTP